MDKLASSQANLDRIRAVEQCFAGNLGKKSYPLSKPGRILIGEGILTKICRKKPKPRQFYLFNDILVYGSILIPKKKLTNQRIVHLADVYIRPLATFNSTDIGFGWQILSRGKSFEVFASTEQEKREWIAHMQNCIRNLTGQDRVVDQQDPKDAAAIWIPDDKATVCMCCAKVKFSAVNRRHHCRKCGRVVCSGCSKKRLVIQDIAQEPVRVCDKCFAAVSASGNARIEAQPTESADASQEQDPDPADPADSADAANPGAGETTDPITSLAASTAAASLDVLSSSDDDEDDEAGAPVPIPAALLTPGSRVSTFFT